METFSEASSRALLAKSQRSGGFDLGSGLVTRAWLGISAFFCWGLRCFSEEFVQRK